MSAGQEVWIVATGCDKAAEQDQTLVKQLRGTAVLGRGNGAPAIFKVPDGKDSLQFGSFDTLVRLTDDLQKADSQMDSIVHRLERQFFDIEPTGNLMVAPTANQKKSFMDYLQSWSWDERKFPKDRPIADTLAFLMGATTRLDDEARTKMTQYSEKKALKATLAKKDAATTLLQRDLVDVLIPGVVKMSKTGSSEDDAIATEHLTTVFVILPRGARDDFLARYETLTTFVVPGSAKKMNVPDDKDGSSLWRVVVFKSQAEAFRKGCRENRWTARDFEYSEEAYQKLVEQRASVEEAVKDLHGKVRSLCEIAWSDAVVSWMHIKAMRVFVESVMRFGTPPQFAAFTMVPCAATPAVRRALGFALPKPSETTGLYSTGKGEGDDGEEFFPYVSFSFTPFVTGRS
jgi:V-type H+-transporting ATPase subunit C